MENITVAEIIKELDISKAYLYKLIEKENLVVPKSDTGRYLWNEEIIKVLKTKLNIEDEKPSDYIEQLIAELGLKQLCINNRRYLGSKYKLLEFIEKIVQENTKNCKIFLDLFAGTGVVADYFNKKYEGKGKSKMLI